MTAAIALPVVENPASRSPDFLKNLQHSGILGRTQFQRIREAVRDGRYPGEPFVLARKLVRGRILTEYQARCLLHHEKPSLVIGRYVILGRLGRGSMGRVYLARHRLMGRLVALKVVNPDIAAGGRGLARFRREMLLVGKLDHPNVIRSFDADRVKGVPYIVMEYLQGRGLDRVLREQGPLAPETVLDYAIQAAEGLSHAHERGVIHRDVKLSNLMVDEDGRLKLLDFGVGALTELHAIDAVAKLTSDGLTVGTVEYMSPEQACGRPLDGRSDLYSLGCVIYHLLTGRVPFPADSKIASMVLRMHVKPASLDVLRPGLPDGLADVVERLMALSPEDRYSSAAEAAAAMRLVLTRHKADPAVADVPDSSSSTASFPRRQAWFQQMARFFEALLTPALHASAIGCK